MNLLFIGPQRSFTTSIWYLAKNHPGLNYSIEKEHNSFCKKNNPFSSKRDYENFFIGNGNINIDVCPQYFANEFAFNSILENFSWFDLIIYLYRDPRARAISYLSLQHAYGRDLDSVLKNKEMYNSFVCNARLQEFMMHSDIVKRFQIWKVEDIQKNFSKQFEIQTEQYFSNYNSSFGSPRFKKFNLHVMPKALNLLRKIGLNNMVNFMKENEFTRKILFKYPKTSKKINFIINKFKKEFDEETNIVNRFIEDQDV
jgi:hypothetical protein